MSKWRVDDSDGIGAPGIHGPGLYAIYFKNKPVYIGQSVSIRNRLLQHMSFYQRIVGYCVKNGAKIEHYMYGTHLGRSRFPETFPISYKCAPMQGGIEARKTREARLIRRIKPMLNRAGVK